MAQVSDQEILEALKGVRDPDRDADIVSLGMVSDLAVKDGNVAFTGGPGPMGFKPDQLETALVEELKKIGAR